MTREYESEKTLSGWYYDIQTDPNRSRLTCVSLHPNMRPEGSEWIDVDYGADPDDNFGHPYALEPICTAIYNEDFNVSVANSWSDFGGDMLGQMWESIKPMAPYADHIQNLIIEADQKYQNAKPELQGKIQENFLSRGLANVVHNIAEKLKSGEVDVAEYLNRSLVMQGTRFSYYSGTGTSFGNLAMKFTIFPTWNNQGEFETVNYQVSKILPYVMGKFITEDVLTTPDLDGIVGWQVPPGGFRADIKHVDNIQEGTLKLKFGAQFAITNLVCESASFSYSSQMVKCPEGARGYKLGGQDDHDDSPIEVTPDLISPLYCDVVIQLRPATKYSDQSVRNFVFGRQTQETLKTVNRELNDNITYEVNRLATSYGGETITSLF
jgi:hypothetical protein